MSTLAQSTQSRIAWHKIAAVIAWFVSVAFTAQFVSTVVMGDWYIIWLISLSSQFLLTIGERPLWKWLFKRPNGRAVLAGILLTLLDGGLNAGGIYPYIPRLSNSPIGIMLIDALQLGPNIGNGAAAFLSTVFGCLVAGLPEYLWEAE